jgi:hypothetical protein
VAEGFNRFHNKDYRHFLYVASVLAVSWKRKWNLAPISVTWL